MKSLSRILTVLMMMCGLAAPVALAASGLSGNVSDPQGSAVVGATITIRRQADSSRREVQTDNQGHFFFPAIDKGEYRLTVEGSGFAAMTQTVEVPENAVQNQDIQFSGIASQTESVSVSADISDAGLFAPDPAQRILIRDETLDANPGRPGMPVSIPGEPVESPAGGVKPPQYFLPGVAGDHGEPIAMFFQVGGFLFQNNLPANAHGNGYADPNVVIPIAIESVETDGGAFNVREGNNSVNSAITFGLRDRIEPMVQLTGDDRDLNLVTGWSPQNPADKL